MLCSDFTVWNESSTGLTLLSLVPCVYAHFTDEDMEAQGSSVHALLSSPPTLLLTQEPLAPSLFQQTFCEQDVEVTGWGECVH